MPYLPTFQPQGVRRDRTEEFVANRRKRSEGKKLEEGRLCRRMEKLVTLHFPPPVEHPTPAVSRPLGISQLAELSGTLRGKTAKDLWRSVAGGKTDAERAEQSIVKWQEDSEATRCPICSAAFGLKTRRHHCRLCGRVVCYLPPTPPADFIAPVVVPTSPLASTPPPPAPPKPVRRERCSTFFTYEYDGLVVPGEKKPVGVIVEIEQVEPDLTLGGVVADVHLPKEKDEREKVRICRECLNIVLRNQDETLPPRTPTWVKLYEVLVQLEKEIEDALPEFQELVLGIQKPSTASSHPPSATAALALRKRLLTNLASYDTISKRIRDLPLTEGGGPGGSQDRLQRAIAARGALFLGEKLSLLRSLGDLDDGAVGKAGKKKKGKGGAATTVVVGEPTVQSLASLMAKGGEVGEKVAEASGQLAVLLEQESLVKGYVEDANARRQFEDAASLKASLDDLREEIARIRAAT